MLAPEVGEAGHTYVRKGHGTVNQETGERETHSDAALLEGRLHRDRLGLLETYPMPMQ